MSDRQPLENGVEPADVDPGEPVGEIARLHFDPDPEFVRRIRRSIERRDLASNVVQVTMFVPVHMAIEFLRAIAEVFESWKHGQRGERPWNKNSD